MKDKQEAIRKFRINHVRVLSDASELLDGKPEDVQALIEEVWEAAEVQTAMDILNRCTQWWDNGTQYEPFDSVVEELKAKYPTTPGAGSEEKK